MVQGFELDWVEGTDVLSAAFSGRSAERMASIFVLHPRWAMLPGFSSGFSRAAWLSQTIDHSIVPRVIDSGVTEDRLPFVALEFVGGESLESYLERRRGTVPPAEALRIGASLADGLAALAERGAVHGAVQPRSVALMDSGAVRLLHTGWTRLRQQAAAHLGSSSIPGLAGYLSPAQASGQVPTPQDDLWSCAAIVFELLAGVPLCPGETDADALVEARTGQTLLFSSLFAGAPTGIIELMERALCRDATLRINSAAEFARKCRSLAQFPDIQRLRRLARQASPERAGSDREQPENPMPSKPATGHSGVSALNLPFVSATGTSESRGSRATAAPHGNAGAYSSRNSEQRVETLIPKKQ